MEKTLFEKVQGHSNTTSGGMRALAIDTSDLTDEQTIRLLLMCVVHLKYDRLNSAHVTGYVQAVLDADDFENGYDPDGKFVA